MDLHKESTTANLLHINNLRRMFVTSQTFMCPRFLMPRVFLSQDDLAWLSAIKTKNFPSPNYQWQEENWILITKQRGHTTVILKLVTENRWYAPVRKLW